MDAPIIIVLVLAVALGASIGFLFGKLSSVKRSDEALETERKKSTEALEAERRLSSSRLAEMKDVFSAVAAEALQNNNSGFLALAKQTLGRFQDGAVNDLERREKAIEALVMPVKETLSRFEASVQEMEKARVGAYEGLSTQVKGLFEAQQGLRSETSNLVNALKSPRVRGRWGEIQLRRVVELAGMIGHCDFIEQLSLTSENGRLRPDMIVNLPGQNTVVVDAKTPLDQYLLAMEATSDGEKRAHLTAYAAQIRAHVAALSNKNYWEQFSPTPEFVFMFLPGESFFSAALEADPSLIESGVVQRVIIATPTTLIALLKAVAYGWRQEKLATDSENISKLGKELYDRVCKMGDHFINLGGALRNAVDRYNETLGTLESRVFVSARRFKDMPIAGTDKQVENASQIDSVPRQIQVPELNGPDQSPVALSAVR